MKKVFMLLMIAGTTVMFASCDSQPAATEDEGVVVATDTTLVETDYEVETTTLDIDTTVETTTEDVEVDQEIQ